ncbi:MAG: redoxin family protein [Actinomycetota bacterium]|nr:redoxin family protein [Actinomycetota bacterium]
MSNKIVWFVIAAGVVVMVVGVALAGTLGSDPAVVGSALIDKPAPEMVLDELEGDGQVRLSDHLGDMVVINFWASWCTGCRQEHASLDAAAADYANFDVTFFSVNTQDEETQAIGFLDRFGRSDETVYGIDHGSNAAFSYGVAGLPETFFVDRSGIVVGKVIGPVTYELLTATIDRVLLGEDIDSVKTGETEQG